MKVVKQEIRSVKDENGEPEMGPRYYYEDEKGCERDYDLNAHMMTLYDTANRLEKDRIFWGGLSKYDPEHQLDSIAKEITIRGRITASEIFIMGELFMTARKICKQTKKGFEEWVNEKVGYSYETALNLINVYKQCFGFRWIALKINPSILYKISAPSFNDELREYLFTSGRLDQITNGKFREITRRFKEGGFDAIKEDVEELSRVGLIIKQAQNTLDMTENALRFLEAFKKQIEMRGVGMKDIIHFTAQIEKFDEPESAAINGKLYDAIQTAIDMMQKAYMEAVKEFSDLFKRTKKKCGVNAANGKFTEMENLQKAPTSDTHDPLQIAMKTGN